MDDDRTRIFLSPPGFPEGKDPPPRRTDEVEGSGVMYCPKDSMRQSDIFSR